MQERTNETEVAKLDFSELLRNFRKIASTLWWLPLVLMVLLSSVQYYRAYKSYRPYYKATASFAVNANYVGMLDVVDNSQYYDSQVTSHIVSSFPYIINSEAMSVRLRQTLSAGYINGSISASAVGDSNLLTINVVSSNPDDAMEILLAVIENYPQVASYVVGGTLMEAVEEPNASSDPINVFNGTGTIVKWAFLGLILGCGVILLFALGRKTICRSADLKSKVSVPYLGGVPQVRVKRRNKSPGAQVSILGKTGSGLNGAFNAIRVKLLRRLGSGESGTHMVMVTSTLPGEGKTTVSFNLAASLAQSGHSVILVDADLRNQSIKRRFGVTEPSAGLMELLRAPRAEVSRVLQTVPGLPMKLLAGDTQVSSAMSLVDSAKMRELLQQLRGLAEYVIVDAPPTGILADASILAQSCDEVVYVVRYDAISRRQVIDGMQTLTSRDATMAGFIINGKPAARTTRYGYGKYGYGKYGYGKYGYGNYGFGSRRQEPLQKLPEDDVPEFLELDEEEDESVDE